MSWETVCAPLIHGEEGCAKAVPALPGWFTTYLDATGTPTMGWGSTGPDIYMGLVWSQEQCDTRFAVQMESFASEVDTLVKVPINENQKAALVSFVYNVGEGNLKGSTLLKLLNEGDYAGAAAQFLLWTHSKGQVLAGLVKRRADENRLFLTPIEIPQATQEPISPTVTAIRQAVAQPQKMTWWQWLLDLLRKL